MKFSLKRFLPFSIFLVTIASVSNRVNLPLDNITIWWIVYAVILIAFYKARKVYFDNSDNSNILLIRLYLLWNIICIIRGIFTAENYWEWKNLVSTAMVLLLPLTVYVTSNIAMVQLILKFWIKYALPAFFLFLPLFMYGDAYGRYLVPVSFLLLFFPLLTGKWKLILVILTVLVIVIDLSARSNVIKFGLSLLFGLSLYFSHRISRILKLVRMLFLVAPLILLLLAVAGQFNVFRMQQYIQGDYSTGSSVTAEGEVVETSFTDDTRTDIYAEALSSALRNGYIIFGRTPARGNDSELFGLILADELKTGKMERFSNEVSILNVFTWTGTVGVILYFFIFYKASYLAMYKSSNKASKVIGLFIAFRWSYAWVEDFSNFDLSYFFLWLTIGLGISSNFRNMSDDDVKEWIRGIFRKPYKSPKFIPDYKLHHQSLVN